MRRTCHNGAMFNVQRSKGLAMKEVLYVLATVAVFAGWGVLLAWRG